MRTDVLPKDLKVLDRIIFRLNEFSDLEGVILEREELGKGDISFLIKTPRA